jgi:hypothetical protein
VPPFGVLVMLKTVTSKNAIRAPSDSMVDLTVRLIPTTIFVGSAKIIVSQYRKHTESVLAPMLKRQEPRDL